MSELSSDICGVGGQGKETILVFLIYFIIIIRVVEGRRENFCSPFLASHQITMKTTNETQISMTGILKI
jgi:hypothetical protein